MPATIERIIPFNPNEHKRQREAIRIQKEQDYGEQLCEYIDKCEREAHIKKAKQEAFIKWIVKRLVWTLVATVAFMFVLTTF